MHIKADYLKFKKGWNIVKHISKQCDVRLVATEDNLKICALNKDKAIEIIYTIKNTEILETGSCTIPTQTMSRILKTFSTNELQITKDLYKGVIVENTQYCYSLPIIKNLDCPNYGILNQNPIIHICEIYAHVFADGIKDGGKYTMTSNTTSPHHRTTIFFDLIGSGYIRITPSDDSDAIQNMLITSKSFGFPSFELAPKYTKILRKTLRAMSSDIQLWVSFTPWRIFLNNSDISISILIESRVAQNYKHRGEYNNGNQD